MQATPSSRLVVAFLLYGALAASAFFSLRGEVRVFVLIFFAALAVKTWLAHARAQLDAAPGAAEASPGKPDSPHPPTRS
jgi:hypothetical protein